MRVAVLIPHTAGVAVITRLVRHAGLIRSVIIVEGDYRPIADLSERYDALTGVGGPLERSGVISSGMFEMGITESFDTGRSWELPVSIAHYLRERGHTLVARNPEHVFVATGSLDVDGAIVEQAYSLDIKVQLALGVAEELDPSLTKTSWLLPAREVGMHDLGVLVRPVFSLSEAVLEVHNCLPLDSGPDRKEKVGKRKSLPMVASGASVGAAVLLLVVLQSGFFQARDDNFIGLIGNYAVGEATCVEALFNDEITESEVIEFQPASRTGVELENLCSLEVVLRGVDKQISLQPATTFLEQVMGATLEETFLLRENKPIEFFLIDRPRPVTFSLTVVDLESSDQRTLDFEFIEN